MKCRVLVVDDEDSFREFLVEVLEDAGYGVVGAASGVEGLELAQRDKFDVIITDMIMPKMRGVELIAHLRLSGSEVPIIAITGNPDGDASLVVAETFNADCVMKKPFTADQIVAVIEKLCRKKTPDKKQKK